MDITAVVSPWIRRTMGENSLPLRDYDFPGFNLELASQSTMVTGFAGCRTGTFDLVLPATFAGSRDSLLDTSLVLASLLHWYRGVCDLFLLTEQVPSSLGDPKIDKKSGD